MTRPRDLPYYAAIAAIFAASRLWAASQGVRFQSEYLGMFWQYLDPPLLQHDLLRSLWLLHAQPPLLNLLIGLALKAFGPDWDVFFRLLFMGLGLGMNLALFALLRRLGLGPRWALAPVLLYLLSPTQLLYENLFLYSYPTAALFTFAALALLILYQQRSLRAGHAVLWCVVLVSLMRGSYHLLFLILPVAAVAYALGWRRAARMAMLPVLLVALWYGKNFAMFGLFNASSWGGMSFARITLMGLTPDQRADLAQRSGDKLATLDSFLALPYYEGLVEIPALREPAALYAPNKTNGSINFNHRSYIELSRRYGALGKRALLENPRRYLESVGVGWMLSFGPADQYFLIESNRRLIEPYADAYDLWVLGAGRRTQKEMKGDINVMPSFICLLLFPYCVARLAWNYRRRAADAAWRARRAWLACAFVLIFYSLTLHNFVEIAENNRFRLDWEPLMIALMALALWEMLVKKASRV